MTNPRRLSTTTGLFMRFLTNTLNHFFQSALKFISNCLSISIALLLLILIWEHLIKGGLS
jgi:TRAP-type C4-dicarboxylate transport system permease small subunit